MNADQILQLAEDLNVAKDQTSIAFARAIAARCAEIADATFSDGTTPGNAIREAFGAMTR